MVAKLLSVLMLFSIFSCRTAENKSNPKDLLVPETNRLERGHGVAEYWGEFLKNLENPANPETPYWVEGEEGTPCTLNTTEPANPAGTGCNDGFMCIRLRGTQPTCYRKCSTHGSEAECKNYKGPGESLCAIQNDGDMRGPVPIGINLCVVRCGGLPSSPQCVGPDPVSLGLPEGTPFPVRCTGECAGKWKCGRVLEFDGPLRCG